jgi:transcriptional regulator GlxA family with amidase domain
MFGNPPRELPQRIGLILIPRFSLISFTSMVEAMRLANRMAGRELYRWRFLSTDGRPVRASSGLSVEADSELGSANDIDCAVVCGGIDIQRFDDRQIVSWLRRMGRRGLDIGAMCTGSHILARAGLLDGHRCTIHWENLAGFLEDFPDVEVTAELFEIDRKRFTCSGGTAAIDLMLNVISRQHGHELAAAVADQLMHERIRDERDHQRMSLPARLGVRHPRQACLSTRQLERLFRKYLSRSPARYYLELRLHKARLLLLQTNMSVIDVALACGFVSASHFSKCYRDFFGRTPRKERNIPAHPEARLIPAAAQ